MRNIGYTSLLMLGIKQEDLEENISRFISWTSKQRKIRLNKIKEKTKDISYLISEITEYIINDSMACANSGVNYSNPDSNLIKLGISDYFFNRKQTQLK